VVQVGPRERARVRARRRCLAGRRRRRRRRRKRRRRRRSGDERAARNVGARPHALSAATTKNKDFDGTGALGTA